ncbi:hypothetical protein L6259_00960 [Candidatus Parcubacteria bacterium]|nr:hypothetical protein [Patescibacteria group bacterium]MCG2693842.1 hypothetical protein [Candidatus Parcubacteria bacterium]
MELQGIHKKVFLDRYAAKDENGNLIEYKPEEMWLRVAKTIAKVEKADEARQSAEYSFYDAMENFKFIPGGRILSGAGAIGQRTFYNCFVIPSPADSRGGIMESVTRMAEIMARGGGVGVNISTLRPKGSYVKGVNGTASGAVSFGGLYSYVTGLITQGGSRRGALMLMLDVNHPDIEEFITVKRTMGLVTNANLSVCVSDAFMEAVKADADWDLIWKEKTYRTVRAKAIWDMICESAWASGEPGVFFMERANKQSNSWYFEELISTNPCVSGDTKVFTKEGLKTIEGLWKSQKNIELILDSRLSDKTSAITTKIVQTGVKDIYNLKTSEGYELKLTKNHRVKTERGWVEAQNLTKGDNILLLNRQGGFGSEGDLSWGQTLGWFVGDGHFNAYDNRAVLSFFGEEKRELAPVFARSINSALNSSEIATVTPLKIQFIKGRDEARIVSRCLAKLIENAGLKIGKKLQVPIAVWNGNEEMQRGFLQGLFTADGHTAGTLRKGVSVRLTSISLQLLKDVQILLLNFGIKSVIYENRRTEQKRALPDGKGGSAEYLCKSQHDLHISKDMLKVFAEKIGFLSAKKQDKLLAYLQNYKKGPYKHYFVAKFESLEHIGEEMVYDLTEPLTHSFSANGLIVHNCGEQPLGAWGVCNLGSINLSNFVKNDEVNWQSLRSTIHKAIHLLDNAIDVTEYFYPENEMAQKNVRRVGLGTMGLADMLIKLKIRYGTDEAIAFCDKLFSFLRDESYRASVELAKIKGSFPKFDAEKYLQGYFIKQLPEDIRAGINQYGIRNAFLLTQAPTGSTGLLANASSGIEPVYDFVTIRKDRLGEHEIMHPLYEKHQAEHPNEEKPKYFVTAKELSPSEHIKMQAVIQKYIDSSISKTVNAPNSHTEEEVRQLYIQAYDLGCKGMTYYRDGSRDLAVLYSKEEKKEQTQETNAPKISLTPKPRPEVCSGSTYKIKTGYGTLFVTVNDDENGKPFEVFATIGKTGGFFAAKSEAICRLISLALRSGIDVEEVFEQLRGIRGPMPSWSKYGQVLSIPDAIGVILREHINAAQQKLELGFKKPQEKIVTEEKLEELPAAGMEDDVVAELRAVEYSKTKVKIADRGFAPECPECHAILELSEGCMLCRSCGYSKCS